MCICHVYIAQCDLKWNILNFEENVYLGDLASHQVANTFEKVDLTTKLLKMD